MLVRLVEYRFARAILKEHVVGRDDRSPSVDVEDIAHVLHEIELFVAGRGLKTVADHRPRLRDGASQAGFAHALVVHLEKE